MPKTKKREEQRRAARIAKAHATKLPETQEKDTQRRHSPSHKAPARGIARYPWAITLILLLIVTGIIAAYVNHVGPFALPKPQPHPTTSQLHATATAQARTKATTAAKADITATTTAKGNTTTVGQAPISAPCTQASILSQITDTSAAPSASDIQNITHTYSKEPAMSIDQHKVYCAGINTDRGLIVLELDPNQAAHTVNSFVFLAQHHFYDGLKFHRVLPGTIIQGGDPGSGGPGYSINDEPVKGDYTTGTIAMAKTSAPNSAGSQFFINLKDNSTTFPKNYTIFGHIVQGLAAAQKIQGPGDDASSKNIAPDRMNHVIVVPAP